MPFARALLHPVRRVVVDAPLRLAVGAAVALTMLLATATASALTISPVSPWKDLTGDTGTNLTAVQTLRDSATGPLHVVWSGPESDLSSRSALYLRDVLPSGALGPRRTLLAGTLGIANPGIARNPADGTDWVYAAGASVLTGRLFAISSTDGFATATPATPISKSGYAYSADDATAVFTATGQAWQSFGATVKRGTGEDPDEDDLTAAPGIDTGRAGTCCVYWSQLAADAVSGDTAVAWYSNSGDATPPRSGIEVVALPSGTTTYAPGSANAARTSSANGDGPTSLTGRIGAPGIFAGYCGGYPTCTTALVWRVGTAKPQTVATQPGLDHARIAAAPGGRIWATWYAKGTVWARRSNPAVNVWGPVVSVAVPGGADASFWRLAADGTRGPLEVFASIGADGADRTWTTRLLPALSIASAAKAAAGGTLSVQVTDAGVPVPGAKVKVRSTTATTNAAGKATFVLSTKAPVGKALVSASAGGFTGATRMVTIVA